MTARHSAFPVLLLTLLTSLAWGQTPPSGRSQEALNQGRKLVQEGKHADRARELIDNPVRARKNFFPDFEMVTLAGDRLRAKDLRGKVILVDFWGTWCPPCVAAVPSLRTMSKRMTEEPFVLLSISTDQDRGVLNAFVDRHEMKWPQVWDQGSAFTHKCKVDSFPTYVLVSHEGEILYSASGWSTRIERDLGKKVSSAIQAAKSVKSK